jgi:hypothetical protein
MAALTGPRITLVRQGSVKKTTYQLPTGYTAYDGGMACIDTANPGYVYPGRTGSTTLIPIGWFSCDGSVVGPGPVGVECRREHEIQYWDSVTGAGAVTSANMFQELYVASDHELTTVSTGASPVGRMWSYSPQGYPGGIGIEPPFGA